MRKQLLFTTLALTLVAAPAFAQDDAAKDGHKGHRGEKMFEKHDTDGDGVISKTEFLTKAEERFTKMDQDGNGEVTKEEAEAAHAEMKAKMKEFREKRKAKEAEEDAPAE